MSGSLWQRLGEINPFKHWAGVRMRLGERLDRQMRDGLSGILLLLVLGVVLLPAMIFVLAGRSPEPIRNLGLIADQRALVAEAGLAAAGFSQPPTAQERSRLAALIQDLALRQRQLEVRLPRATPGLRALYLQGTAPLNERLSEFIDSGKLLAEGGPGVTGADLLRLAQGSLARDLAAAAALSEAQTRALAWQQSWKEPALALLAPLGAAALLLGMVQPAMRRARRLVANLERFAGCDPLTGVLNQNAFMVRLHRLVRPDLNARSRVGLVLLDVDHFRAFNALHGDHTADLALRHLARRLRHTLGDAALVARLGSDQFAVAFPGIADRAALGLAAQQLSRLIGEPMEINDQPFRLEASGGAALAPDDAADRAELVERASQALARAKREERGSIALYAPSGDATLERRARMFHALESGDLRGLTVHLQPLFEGRSLALRGFEALARWHHPELGQIPPNEFLPAARSTNRMAAVFTRLLDASFAAVNQLREAAIPFYRIGINIGAAELAEPELLALLPQALDRAGLTPSDIEIQATETLLTESATQAARDLLADLRKQGAWLVLDDFGTGYSSLPLLQRFAVDALMIDGVFVRGIGDADGRAEEMIRAMIGLARGFGIAAVAENVETPQQLAFLRGLGCDAMQGYFFAPAMPVSAIPAWWSTYAVSR